MIASYCSVHMTIIPNEKKLTASLVFINLTALFTNYCNEEATPYVLHYRRDDDVITISLNSDDMMQIAVNDQDIQINELKNHSHLLKSSKDFLHSLVA